MKFAKLHGTGNDFVMLEPHDSERDWGRLARKICARRFGVGSDGLILVQPSEEHALKMQIFNPDGSEAEACGNGLRCLAKYAIERGLVDCIDFIVETIAGPRHVRGELDGEKVHKVRVSMGSPLFAAEQIPFLEQFETVPQLAYPLELEDQTLVVALVSMGNPHAVTFISTSVQDFPLESVGPRVEQHSLFPQRTNFEIARVVDRATVEARVWERGVGETLACGTGACAVAVVGRLLGYVDHPVDVQLAGGMLTIAWDGTETGEVILSGPVQEVFIGDYLEQGEC
jgi:diaminopimelate epimerase